MRKVIVSLAPVRAGMQWTQMLWQKMMKKSVVAGAADVSPALSEAKMEI